MGLRPRPRRWPTMRLRPRLEVRACNLLTAQALEVRVSGGLSEEDRADLTAPKRFNVDITRGQVQL